MAVSVIAVHPNQTLAPSGVMIFSGIVECLFHGDGTGAVTRDTLTFTIGPVSFPGSTVSSVASCTMSLASFAYDGTVNDALWAVDSATVPAFVNVDRGSGTAHLQVVGSLAVRGLNGVILRVNYLVFYTPS